MVSFRLGGEDGVAVEAAKWAGALELRGWTVRSVAGAGQADVLLPGLAMHAPEPPTRAEVDAALAGALKESSRWHVVYDDGDAIVFRTGARPENPVFSAASGGKDRDRKIMRSKDQLARIEPERRTLQENAAAAQAALEGDKSESQRTA